MLRLSDSIIWQRIFSELIKGNVLRTTDLFIKKTDNKPLFERIVLLNNNFSQNGIYYVMTTSQVDWYKNNWGGKMQYCSVWLDIGTVDLFDRTTVINCREVGKLTKQDLFNRYAENKLDFLGILPEEILKRVLESLINSKLIEDDILKEII